MAQLYLFKDEWEFSKLNTSARSGIFPSDSEGGGISKSVYLFILEKEDNNKEGFKKKKVCSIGEKSQVEEKEGSKARTVRTTMSQKR